MALSGCQFTTFLNSMDNEDAARHPCRRLTSSSQDAGTWAGRMPRDIYVRVIPLHLEDRGAPAQATSSPFGKADIANPWRDGKRAAIRRFPRDLPRKVLFTEPYDR